MSNFKINNISFSGTETLYMGGPGVRWSQLNDPHGENVDIELPLNNTLTTQPMARILRFSVDKTQFAAEMYCYVGYSIDGNNGQNIYGVIVSNFKEGKQYHQTFHEDSGSIHLHLKYENGGLIVVGAIEIDPILPPDTSKK